MKEQNIVLLQILWAKVKNKFLSIEYNKSPEIIKAIKFQESIETKKTKKCKKIFRTKNLIKENQSNKVNQYLIIAE